MIDDRSPTLSAEGVARKESILRDLLVAQRRRAVRRRTTRVGAAMIAVAAVGLAGWGAVQGMTLWSGPRITRSSPPTVHPIPVAPEAPSSLIQIVSSDPGITARLTAGGESGGAKIISDDELDRALVRAGRMPGSIRAGGRFILASDVAHPHRPPPGSG